MVASPRNLEKELPEIARVLSALSDPKDIQRFLADLLTPAEIEAIAERWAIIKLLASGRTQREVRDELQCSITTVTRGSRQLQHGTGGFQRALSQRASSGGKK